jgi:hypothetical protein
MKPITIVGAILLAAGILALVYQGISYTTSEEVVDIGPLEVREQDTESIPLPPIVGVIGILAGVGLIVAGTRR